jgi:hypothetical protein
VLKSIDGLQSIESVTDNLATAIAAVPAHKIRRQN